MAIVALVTGGSLADADNARKIISKGKKGDVVWEGKMRSLEAHFKDKGSKIYPSQMVNSFGF